MSANKLMLGGGAETKNYQRAGWVVLDGCSDYGADHIATIPPLPEEISARKWSLISAIHFIEHLYLEDAADLLRDIYIALDGSGLLVLEQADFSKVMRFALGEEQTPIDRYPWMKGDPSWFGMRSIYPQREQMIGNELNNHHWGYTPKTLVDLVARCGWKRSKISIIDARTHVRERDFRLEARK